MSIRPLAALVLALSLSACAAGADATAPALDTARPSGAVAIAPRTSYAAWWAATEACSGRNGDFGAVRFFVVPGGKTFVLDGEEMAALRLQQGDRVEIYIAEPYAEHEMVVRHEMLHALLAQPGHPEEYFVQRCGLTWESWAARAFASR